MKDFLWPQTDTEIQSRQGPNRKPSFCDTAINYGIKDKRPDFNNKRRGGQDFGQSYSERDAKRDR